MTMIDKVARAIWDSSFDRMPEPPWDETTELQKRFHRMLACAAIEAMREPTKAMLDAVCSDEPYAMISAKDQPVRETWQAMIDAAIDEHAEGA